MLSAAKEGEIGLALLGTIGSALAAAVRDESHREAAVITFLVTLSGVTVLGIGSAFWGVAAGALALAVQQAGRTKAPASTDIAASGNIASDSSSSNMAAPPGAGKTS